VRHADTPDWLLTAGHACWWPISEVAATLIEVSLLEIADEICSRCVRRLLNPKRMSIQHHRNNL